MFKVGDKLKIKEGMWSDLDYTRYGFNKDTYQIVSAVFNGQYPSISFAGSGYRYDAAYFELVKEEKVKNKFAVGDKVISIKNTPDSEEGFIGFIVRACEVDYDWEVKPLDGGLVDKAFNEDELELLSVGKEVGFKPMTVQEFSSKLKDNWGTTENKPDVINSPKHYAVFEQVEAIQVIASSMTQDQFYGYCLGNILKYRLRAGGKDDVMQELGKADKYQELYTEHKHLCKEVK